MPSTKTLIKNETSNISYRDRAVTPSQLITDNAWSEHVGSVNGSTTSLFTERYCFVSNPDEDAADDKIDSDRPRIISATLVMAGWPKTSYCEVALRTRKAKFSYAIHIWSMDVCPTMRGLLPDCTKYAKSDFVSVLIDPALAEGARIKAVVYLKKKCKQLHSSLHRLTSKVHNVVNK